MEYEIPSKNSYELHHVRPRFKKDDTESVLLFMATAISSNDGLEKNKFKKKLNKAIKLYPGNSSKTKKTIDNWRTEISALFGLIQYQDTQCQAGKITKMLSENQDLVEFFRHFLFYFQYPGGHLKPKETLGYIKNKIKFKPASYILEVFLAGNKISEQNSFGISKKEVAQFIFNDLRVTRDCRKPSETAKLILQNRGKQVVFVSKSQDEGYSDRYAGDILDYMVLADLLTLGPDKKYYLKISNTEIIDVFISKKGKAFFSGYNDLYTKTDLNIDDIKKAQEAWFDYVNGKSLDEGIFSANFTNLYENIEQADSDSNKPSIHDGIENIIRGYKGKYFNTKKIGDIGEAITITHEKNRMTKLNKPELRRAIKKIPDQCGVGYDIESFLGEGYDFRPIYIEVKTTISKKEIFIYNFRMTSNEWVSAELYKESYFIYRLMLSQDGIKLLIIRDPVGLYKKDAIRMVPRDGADVGFDESVTISSEVLL